MKFLWEQAIYDNQFVKVPVGAVEIPVEHESKVQSLLEHGYNVTIIGGVLVCGGISDDRLATKKTAIKSLANCEVVNAIEDFYYKDVQVKLTLETQINIQNECNIRNLLTYPVAIRGVDGVLEIATPAEFLTLYTAMVKHIRQCREDGWAKKVAIEAMTDEEIMAEDGQ